MADVCLDIDCNDPHELYARGTRALILQNYEAASTILSRAAELLVDHYKDDMHEEMAKVYLDYGKALLGYCREHSDPLGDAVPKESLDESDDDEGADTEEVDESGAANTEEVEDNEESDSHDKPKEIASEASCSADPGSLLAEAEIENNTTEVEPNDLQLAWEVLELAKRILEKSGDRKTLAEVMIVLGEIQLENEAYENAINDMKEGLAIQQELFGKDSRTIAETLYKLGTAYCIDSQVNQAVQCFKDSLDYLTNKIQALEAEEVSTSDLQDEISEIKSLLPEIKDKISEMETYKNEALKKAAEKITETSSLASSDPSPSSSKNASDISHLVKRKRQSEEVDKLSDEAAFKKRAVEVKN